MGSFTMQIFYLYYFDIVWYLIKKKLKTTPNHRIKLFKSIFNNEPKKNLSVSDKLTLS